MNTAIVVAAVFILGFAAGRLRSLKGFQKQADD